MQDDQPRPDLDDAIDAVVPALTTVSDEVAAASLRRTRIALAEPRGGRGWLDASRWRLAAAGAAVLVAVSLWYPRPQERGRVVEHHSAVAPIAANPPVPGVAPVAPPTSARVRNADAAGPVPRHVRRVRATSAARPEPEPPRADPLIALVRAVQDIPEEAWSRGTRGADTPTTLPDVTVDPIVIVPLDIPPVATTPVEAAAPGEP